MFLVFWSNFMVIYGRNNMGEQVLAATQTPGKAGKKWFQGTADAVRQFIWVFEVCAYDICVRFFKESI